MDDLTPCPYCENFEASGFVAQEGKVQVFNFCPVCGRPYTKEGRQMLIHRAEKEREFLDRPVS